MRMGITIRSRYWVDIFSLFNYMYKEQQVFSIEAYNQNSYATMLQRHQKSSHNLGLVFDADETIYLTDLHHYNQLCSLALLYGYTGDFPTYEQTLRDGEKRLLQPLLGVDDEGWDYVKEQLRDSTFVNSGAPPTDTRILNIVNKIGNMSENLGILTAKPGTFSTVQTAEADIFGRFKFPRVPMYFRPPTTSLSQSADVKIGVMSGIQDAVPEKIVAIFDDSTGSAAKFKVTNEQRIAEGKKPLVFIIYDCLQAQDGLAKMGYRLNSDVEVHLNNSGIYVATWPQLPETLGKIKAQWSSCQNS
jgi:hypothetical protein